MVFTMGGVTTVFTMGGVTTAEWLYDSDYWLKSYTDGPGIKVPVS